jgi:hypothetical protein
LSSSFGVLAREVGRASRPQLRAHWADSSGARGGTQILQEGERTKAAIYVAENGLDNEMTKYMVHPFTGPS